MPHLPVAKLWCPAPAQRAARCSALTLARRCTFLDVDVVRHQSASAFRSVAQRCVAQFTALAFIALAINIVLSSPCSCHCLMWSAHCFAFSLANSDPLPCYFFILPSVLLSAYRCAALTCPRCARVALSTSLLCSLRSRRFDPLRCASAIRPLRPASTRAAYHLSCPFTPECTRTLRDPLRCSSLQLHPLCAALYGARARVALPCEPVAPRYPTLVIVIAIILPLS